MKCDVTKVTYNMYSCDTCFMSRERMEMDGRDSAKCQKSKRRDTNGIIEFVNESKDKIANSVVSFFKSKEKMCRRKGNLQRLGF